jgi:ADP-dependent phosphofructokinase/glucokinase
MDIETWQDLYRTIRVPSMHDTVVGFNLNLDRSIPVTQDLIDSPFFQRENLWELRTRLVRSMQYCTAEEWFVSDSVQFAHLARSFSGTGSLVIGGQAGIAALHLSSLGIRRVVCAAPAHGPESADLLANAGVIVPEFTSGNSPAVDTIHLVFEYPPGLVPLAPGVLPRNNRFIVSPVHEPSSILIPESSMGPFLDEIASCERAFLSGYQYLHSDAEFAAAAGQISRMKCEHPSLVIHVECVSVTYYPVLRGFFRYILPCADSVGLNEHELFLLLDQMNNTSSGIHETGVHTPMQIIEGAVILSRHLGLKRLHLHTYGYYVLVLRSDNADTEMSRNALMNASREVACHTGGMTPEVSLDGIAAVRAAAKTFGDMSSPGIFPVGSFTIIVVPTLIARDITRTVGLGDILSSTAFVSDIF